MSSSNGRDPPVLDQPQPLGDQLDEVRVVADQDHRAAVFGQRLDQRVAALDVEVVGRLVEDDQVRRVERGEEQRQPRLLAAGEPPDLGRRRCPRRCRRPRAAPRSLPGGSSGRSRCRCCSGVSSSSSSSTWCWAKYPTRSFDEASFRPLIGASRSESSFAKVDLPCAVLPEERDPVVLVDPEVEAAQDRPAVVADADVLEPDDRRRQLLRASGS